MAPFQNIHCNACSFRERRFAELQDELLKVLTEDVFVLDIDRPAWASLPQSLSCEAYAVDDLYDIGMRVDLFGDYDEIRIVHAITTIVSMWIRAWGHVQGGFVPPGEALKYTYFDDGSHVQLDFGHHVQLEGESLMAKCLTCLADLQTPMAPSVLWPRHWRNAQRVMARLSLTIAQITGCVVAIDGWWRDLAFEGIEPNPGSPRLCQISGRPPVAEVFVLA